jgi:hypothetical protein
MRCIRGMLTGEQKSNVLQLLVNREANSQEAFCPTLPQP